MDFKNIKEKQRIFIELCKAQKGHENNPQECENAFLRVAKRNNTCISIVSWIATQGVKKRWPKTN